MSNGKYYVYILECSDRTYYTGITNDLKKRIVSHNSSAGAKYTSGRSPVTLVYKELHGDKSEALKREMEIKTLTRAQKAQLIECGKCP